MKKRIHLILTFTIFLTFNTLADEGMWIPMLLDKYNITDMQQKGFKLSAEDIYSINKASLKDAVVIFGGGCTAELISDSGLIITNHHCGFSNIQSHSSLEYNYITNGFWAYSREQELPNPGLTVTFLIKMEDVTEQVLQGVEENITEILRNAMINKNIKDIEIKATQSSGYRAKVRPFFSGNAYYLFLEEIFRDVRLVGAPPSGIGKFGGDTDNWMWPRHTGDFSLFRIYAGKDNKPADYSPDNVPYKPKKFFPISIKGIKKDDFTMVIGFPGRTQEYIPSFAVKMIMETENPHQIKIRENKLMVLDSFMASNPQIRIQYASKQASISNYWKKWMGENFGLKETNAIQKKIDFEQNFQNIVNNNESLKNKYKTLLPDYQQVYELLTPFSLADTYNYEAGFSLDIIQFAKSLYSLLLFDEKSKPEEIKDRVEKLKKSTENFFKNYNQEVDLEIFKKVITLYYNNLEKKFQPKEFELITKKFKGNTIKYCEYLYSESKFTEKQKALDFLTKYKTSLKPDLENDPLIKLFSGLVDVYYNEIQTYNEFLNTKIDSLQRLYMKAQMEIDSNKLFYPDANSTMRITYGKIEPYTPKDGVEYDFTTTLQGIIEKDNPEIYDYNVPEKMRQLIKNKDFGDYSENGTVPVCFIASNHTSGGNSGSPVINADGHLIGVNFDRNWEGTMSDINYDKTLCRNISLDIRFVLFIIDKYAEASNIINELEIIK